MEHSIQELEKEASQVCKDFTAFCNYLTDNKVKLAKQTGNIGKKDCFALNALFYVREDYEGPSNTQNKYPVINFFYYIAVRYRILEINFPGMTMEQGRNYQQFREASVWEQYALFLAVFLFDGRFARGESRWDEDRVAEMWDLYIDRFMEWVETEKSAAGKICQWTGKQRYKYFRCMDYIIPYLEELKLIKVWNKPAAECGEREDCLEFEALPLLETAFELYENELIDTDENAGDAGGEDVCMDSFDEDRMVRYAWEACVSRFGKEKKKGDFSRLFGKVATEGQKQMIDLEVSVRGMDCIRVIRMNLEDSLYDLHQMIQRAVSFDDDHLYEFCVGTGMMKRVYLPSDALDSGRELSVDMGLDNLDLYKGQKFTYLFDFGDMWYFDIKVLEIREGTVEKPEVIKAVGDAPEQYPFYEEEEAWEEWQKPENRTFEYPDVTRIDAGESQESQNAVRDWEEYIEFHLNIDWRTAEILMERIPAMAATGVLQKEEIVAAYKEMLRGTGCRVTKKAENLIGALLMDAPLASQKGNARVKDHVVREKTPAQKTSEEKASRQGKRPEDTTEKGMEAEKAEAEEYKQLSIFDL